jgi:TolA-binding protein
VNVIEWHPEDLIDRRLAGELTDDERRELDEHLETCAACRMEALLADDLAAFEDEETEGEEVARLVRGVVEDRDSAEPPDEERAPPSRRRRASAGLIIGAVVLVAGSAAALYRATAPPPSGTAEPVSLPRDWEHLDDPVVEIPAAPSMTSSAPTSKPDEQLTSAPSARAAAPTAASLFAQANGARRAGDRARALRLYQVLQTRFPSSPEARLSKATVGRMMLEGDDPEAAVDAYDGYLEDGQGAVSEEALVGRATALQRLGKKEEERATWQTLLSRYPDSIHADRARARLSELSGAK